MTRANYTLLTLAMAVMPAYAAAYEYNAFGGDQDDCFAKAMIGMDSVINSRLGVPPEHALDLTILQPAGTDNNTYDNDTLNVILSAYLWEDSPHAYAVRVFYKCAQQKAYRQQASME
ncbi:MAG: hypothetical protein L0Z73_05230 [Gammaproteobacteria bacterium]|nr:hypothetical protein [Gammaproteobacteria bacterium]